MDIGPAEAFRIYKARESVKGYSDTAENVLSMDHAYIHDDHRIMSQNLVTFESLYLHKVIALWIADASLTSRCSPEDVRDICASVYYGDLFRPRSAVPGGKGCL